MVPKLNTKTEKEASNAKQMHSLFSSTGQNVHKMSHKEFKDLNWLSIITRYEQCVTSIVLKFINGNCPYYLNEVFEFRPKVILV